MRPCLFLLLILALLITPAAAAELTEVSGTTSYNGDPGEGYIFSMVKIEGVDPGTDTEISLNSDTYTFNLSIDNVNSYSSYVNSTYTNKVSGEVSNYSDKWYYLFYDDFYFEIGSPGTLYGDTDVGYVAGAVRTLTMLSDDVVYAPTEFTLTSDAPVDLELYTVEGSQVNTFEASAVIMDIIGKVPVVGAFIVSALEITGALASGFFAVASLVVEGWPILLLTFECFVLMRAIVIMQGRGKITRRLGRSIESIVNDNRVMIEFVINAFTRLVSLVFDAVKAVGSWIPFT